MILAFLLDNPHHLLVLWSVRSSDGRMKPSPIDGSLIFTSTSFSLPNMNFRQATAKTIFLGHKWTVMFMGNKFLFVACSSWQLCFHTRENKTVFCTPAIPNSIARCLNVNIYWAVTFLQHIYIRIFFIIVVWGVQLLVGCSKQVFPPRNTCLCWKLIDWCSLFELCLKADTVNQETGLVSSRDLQLWPFCMFLQTISLH